MHIIEYKLFQNTNALQNTNNNCNICADKTVYDYNNKIDNKTVDIRIWYCTTLYTVLILLICFKFFNSDLFPFSTHCNVYYHIDRISTIQKIKKYTLTTTHKVGLKNSIENTIAGFNMIL